MSETVATIDGKDANMPMNNKDPRAEYAQAFDEEAAIDAEQVNPEDVIALEGEQEADVGLQLPQELEQAQKEGEEGGQAQAGAQAGAEAQAEQPAAEAAPTQAVDLDKEVQRLKSWEGRLKAREAQLKEREDAQHDSPAGEVNEEQAAQALTDAAQQVAQGAPLDEALQAIGNDFGEDFAQALSKLVLTQVNNAVQEYMGGQVEQRFARVSDDVSAIVEAIRNDKQREHFELIAEQHPDFLEVGQSEDFQRWVDGKGQEAKDIVNAGSARQVCALLHEFKKGQQQGDPEQPATPDAQPDAGAGAVAVVGRAAGLRLPAKPAASDDYLSAWEAA